ncbi:S8 family serine peptidase [Cryomorpha ignava]|uniref:S8 family serine peptidase n=1 Tax=Cryomorpha ignava TaxID=101383 RepID=A0A7K3WNW6_9FLAO|nr:S8 family serine peptidase [Cryomorpha ignava]NEN23218.1 S8 family serine peptidase [Cryomorpha ignava]
MNTNGKLWIMGWNRLSLIFIALFLLPIAIQAQVANNRFLVYFTDKANTPFSLSQPEAYLSQRAIERRINQNIAIDSLDLPVDPAYIQAVQNLGDVEILFPIKWMNAILIETTDPAVILGLNALSGFDRLEVSRVLINTDELIFKQPMLPKSDADYGPSLNQIEMLNGLTLHSDGFRGEGKWIGVLDGGFTHAPNAWVLDSLFLNNRIIGTKNFVDGDDGVYERSSHGTYVLSTMAGWQIDSLIGTAPKASYFLGITEDVTQERRIEEVFWEIGAEYADSLGVDIINTSLGYTTFDVIDDNYTYADIDGNTALITRASDIAASRGMLIVTSAGNEGNNQWYYVGAPADGDSVLTIGSVDAFGDASTFSSRGPTFDGRVKPNVMAQGGLTVISDLDTGIKVGNGTSFASPVLAGMAACLWQAFPDATAWQVFRAIEQSASLFEMPNDSMGYGIPDFEIARVLLGQVLDVNSPEVAKRNNAFMLYPNPYSEGLLHAELNPELSFPISLAVLSSVGKVTSKSDKIADKLALEQKLTQNMIGLASGVYVILLQDAKRQAFASRLIKR